jgi:hypothetical protein
MQYTRTAYNDEGRKIKLPPPHALFFEPAWAVFFENETEHLHSATLEFFAPFGFTSTRSSVDGN